MTRILIQEDADHPDGGFARVLVEGMAGQIISAVTIAREGFGADSLGPRGWQVAAARLAPDSAFDQGAHLVLILGPDVVEHLEAGPIRLGLPEIDLTQVVMWPDIAPLPAAKRAGFATARRAARAERPAPPLRGPDPLPAPDTDATVVISRPPPVMPPSTMPPPDPAAPASPSRRRAPIYALVMMLVAAASLGGWIYQDEMMGLWAQPEQVVPPVADPLDTATPAQIAAMNLAPAQILAVAERRQARAQHQDALLLLELAAAQNHPPAISALARLYDPASFTQGGALSVPNPAKAAQYWRAAERAGDPAAAPARAALRDRLSAAAQAGDSSAALALQDNWP
ncbi:hypothetical protein ACQW02_25035 [Humitalea sp. 24SJ18S-53]|uniref:hypothetical protein n=1 Tax=Humitalea sp. 24SJ18S-53 TaxID=3422307 RepID=UPI003D669B34